MTGVVTIVITVLFAYAGSLLSRPEPGLDIRFDTPKRRIVFRTAILFVLADSIVILVMVYYYKSARMDTLWHGLAHALFGGIVTYGMVSYLSEYARRIPSDRAARKTARILWGLFAATAALRLLSVESGATSMPDEAAMIGPVQLLIGVLCLVLTLALIVLCVKWLRLMWRFARSFRLAAMGADPKQPWAAA